jgi:exodeoxyribonuclease VII small subunit
MTAEPTFEIALAELEKVLRCLEDGATTLDESLAHYERGVGLLKSCYARLRDAEQRIVQLAGVDADGKPVIQPFEHAASDVTGDAKRRPPPQANRSGLY